MVASLAGIVVSWLTNMGLLRFLLTIFLVPFIHTAFLGAVNGMVLLWLAREWKSKLLLLFSCFSGLGIHLLMPESGEVGEAYFFFGLVQSDRAAELAERFCMLLLIVHIVVLIFQVITIVRYWQKKEKEKRHHAPEKLPF